jgi:hypothetical protein
MPSRISAARGFDAEILSMSPYGSTENNGRLLFGSFGSVWERRRPRHVPIAALMARRPYRVTRRRPTISSHPDRFAPSSAERYTRKGKLIGT